MIIRIEHRERYTIIANQSLRDPRLSFRATGVMAYLLSFQDDVVLSGRNLCQDKREGRDAVLAALAELENAGYLRRERAQVERGKWQTVCTLQEAAPSPGNPDSVPGNQPVTSQKPSPGKPSPGNPDSSTSSTKNEVLRAPRPGNPQASIPRPGGPGDPEFERMREPLTDRDRQRGKDALARLRAARSGDQPEPQEAS